MHNKIIAKIALGLPLTKKEQMDIDQNTLGGLKMFDILIPIKPYWAYLIMKGLKPVEVRKFNITDKNWSGKLKCYVSKDKTSLKRIPEADRAEFEKHIGKVAFEFVKGGVMCEEALHMRHGLKDSCLTHEELDNYSKGKPLYGYRVTALKVYDKPKELSDFRKLCIMSEMPYCPACKFGNIKYSSDEVECSRDIEGASCEWLCTNFVKRPPQSWQYVEKIEE